MKSTLRWVTVLFLCTTILWVSTPLALAARDRSPQTWDSSTGIRAAHTLSLITGVAISPLLGVSSVGLYHWWKTPAGQRANLPWFAQPWFWIPALLVVALVAVKDIFGTAAPTVLKKPFDVAETVENKFSGLIAAGAFVPWVVSLLAHGSGSQGLLLPATSSSGPVLSTIDGPMLASALVGPVAILVFLVVWLAAHTINVLILLSPFTTLDTALKVFRMGLLSLVVATAALN
ncbi:MAG TPA: hypothetical protein VNZ22_23265, partial [Bacillota bacterium]|nr:hypothetical protein [Bacillota bacterium]